MPYANIENAHANIDRGLRRRRLERLAFILETTTTPVQLFSTMECYPAKERLALRAAGSPLALAYEDASFRREGLRGDSVTNGIAFFGLSMREAHKLLCDCGYTHIETMPGVILNGAIASRARKLAAKLSVGEWVDRFLAWASSLTGARVSRASIG